MTMLVECYLRFLHVYIFMDLILLLLPSGISLTVDQWEAFRKAVPAIEDAIMKMQESD